MNTRMQEEVVVGGATSGTIKLWDLDQVVCLMCMPYVYALWVCLICMPYMYVLYGCLICMPYMHAVYKERGYI